jgi:ElaB/YqjD/DUF883 family membrane-anchored ribosome-binding protein
MAVPSIETQLQKLTADLALLAKSVAATGYDRAGAYQAKAGHYAQDAFDMSRDAFSDLRSEFGSLEKTVVNRVRSHPIQTIGIIAGIAFLIALAGTSKSKPS